MNNIERELIKEFYLGKILQDEFIKRFPKNIDNDGIYIKQLLYSAYEEKNPEDIEYILGVAGVFDLIQDNYIEILCKLLASDWHYMHEDIARYLQRIKSEESIEVLYKTVFTKFDYLEYDNSYSLARKCMWALGDICTNQAIQKLKLVADLGDDELKKYAIEQFNREKIKLNDKLDI